MLYRSLIFITCTVLLLAGCAASLPRYPNELPQNVAINLQFKSSGGFLSSSEAFAGINDIAGDCSTHYKGWVKLAQGRNEVGLTIGQPTLLVVELSHSSWGGNGGSMQRGVVITPKSGVHYQIDVNYADAMYDIRLYAISQAGKKRLDILTAPPGCKIGSAEPTTRAVRKT